MNKTKSCFQCGKKGTNLYGYTICDSCKSKLRLLTDDKIKEYIKLYKKSKKHSFEKEIRYRLDFIEKDYIKKKIKLLYILERLKYLKN